MKNLFLFLINVTLISVATYPMEKQPLLPPQQVNGLDAILARGDLNALDSYVSKFNTSPMNEEKFSVLSGKIDRYENITKKIIQSYNNKHTGDKILSKIGWIGAATSLTSLFGLFMAAAGGQMFVFDLSTHAYHALGWSALASTGSLIMSAGFIIKGTGNIIDEDTYQGFFNTLKRDQAHYKPYIAPIKTLRFHNALMGSLIRKLISYEQNQNATLGDMA